jgi:N-acylneuraminate cytidylyltransferase
MKDKLHKAFIFARGGSKGVPGKNVRFLAGKPLIAWSIEQALGSRYINEVIVSTDDELIAETAIKFGALVPFIRPSELASDNSPEILSWRHALEYFPETRIFISVPTVCPLRQSTDIDQAIEKFVEGDADLVITASTPHRNPYFNMVKLNNEGYASVVCDASPITRRQDAPPVFDIATACYVADPGYVVNCRTLLEGRVKVSQIPRSRALDIDDEWDFKLAELLKNEILEP